MTTRIEGWTRELLGRQGMFGTLATISADGTPHQAVVWYLVRGETIVLNSKVGRIWPTNLLRDPRCSMLIEAAYDWASVSGRVEAVTEQARAQADIAEMARRYHAHDAAKAERLIREAFQLEQRISFVLRPERVVGHPDA